MAYADDIATFKNAIRAIYNTLKNATQTIEVNINTLSGDVDTLNQTELNLLNVASNQLFLDQINLQLRGRSMLLPIFSRIGRTIGSSAVSNGTVVDLKQFFEDWREYQLTQIDPTGGGEYVTGKGITVDTDPADSATGSFRRLTEDWNGQEIESGLHNQTITCEVTRKPAPWRVEGTIVGAAGKTDALDYLGGSNGTPRAMTWLTDKAPGGLVINPTWRTTQDTTDGTDLASLTSWTITQDTAAEATIDTSITWRDLAYCIAFAGQNGTTTIQQDIPSGVFQRPYHPKQMFIPAYLSGSWEGNITLTWGGKSQVFTHADLSSSAWVNLAPDADLDLYPVNFDEADPQWKIEVETTSATGEVILAGLYVMEMVEYEHWFYSVCAGDTDPSIEDSVTYEDSISENGKYNTTLGFLWDSDSNVKAYLNTDGGTQLAEPTQIIADYP